MRKSNWFGIAGLAACASIVVYTAYKNHKNKKQVAQVIEDEKIDEVMTEAIENVMSTDFSSSELERTSCASVLKGYRNIVLKSTNVSDMRTAFLNFNIAYKDMQSGTNGIYRRCSKYLDDINKANEKIEDTSTGDLIEIVLKVTEFGVDLLDRKS